jgi:hypothetical protein
MRSPRCWSTRWKRWLAPTPIDTINDHLVCINGFGDVLTLNPALGPMTRDEALRLAAWLVAVADPNGQRFDQIYKAVLAT